MVWLLLGLHFTEFYIPLFMETKLKLKVNKKEIGTQAQFISLTVILITIVLSIVILINQSRGYTLGLLLMLVGFYFGFNRLLYLSYLRKKELQENAWESFVCCIPVINLVGYYKILKR